VHVRTGKHLIVSADKGLSDDINVLHRDFLLETEDGNASVGKLGSTLAHMLVRGGAKL
jgi:hypothetical protein